MESSASIIIVTYNSAHTISDCILSVVKTLRSQDEVMVIDNNSQDNTLELLARLRPNLPENIHILPQSQNYGFSRGCNIGIKNSSKKYVILLNPDTEVMGEWIQRLTDHFTYYRDTGAVGPLSNSCITTQLISTYIQNWNEFDLNSAQLLEILYKTFNRRSIPTKVLIGFCMALRRDLIDEWGGLDEDIFLGDDDLDLSWRLREKGYWLRLALDVYIDHHRQVSFNTLPKSYSNKLLAESSDVLFEKMRQYYHPKKVPDPRIYFGIGWWQPTILRSKSPEEVFESDLLPCPHEDIIPTVQQLIKGKEIEQAIELLRNSLAIIVNDHRLWFALGTLCLKTNQREEAEFALKNAWSLQFYNGKAAEKLKILLKSSGREEEIDTLFCIKNAMKPTIPNPKSVNQLNCEDSRFLK
ncbi:MAG: glycosyltransferase [Caldithrix sp.]|nr:MAG: glycosyltransferase [Caldithrix sp.]